MKNRRVVVTGIGGLTPLGLDKESSWSAALAGQSGIGTITQFDVSDYDVKIAGEVKGFDADKYIPKKEQKKMDRFIHLALAASEMAIEDSGLEWTDQLREDTGVIIGAGMGGLPTIEAAHTTLMERGPSRITPFFIPQCILNLAAGHVSIRFGFKGPNYSVTSACATSLHSIGEAAQYIRSGRSEVMLAGGAESTVCPLGIGGFTAMKALSKRNEAPEKASRPWDKDRDGFVLAEGAGVFVLEELEAAQKRGARIYAEVSGYGVSSDGFHITNPAPGGEGALLAMNRALKDAQLAGPDIDYINAHGTSTPAGDLAETLAIKRLLGSEAKKTWVSSTKSMTGHALGAAGALESLFCLMALSTNKVPPTINLDEAGEDCDLDYVPHTAREKNLKHVMNNSFGFGGTNACLIFSKI